MAILPKRLPWKKTAPTHGSQPTGNVREKFRLAKTSLFDEGQNFSGQTNWDTSVGFWSRMELHPSGECNSQKMKNHGCKNTWCVYVYIYIYDVYLYMYIYSVLTLLPNEIFFFHGSEVVGNIHGWSWREYLTLTTQQKGNVKKIPIFSTTMTTHFFDNHNESNPVSTWFYTAIFVCFNVLVAATVAASNHHRKSELNLESLIKQPAGSSSSCWCFVVFT